MMIAILNGLWIWDEIFFNRYHTNYSKIGQLMETGMDNGDNSMTYPLSVELMENYHANFKCMTRTSWLVEPILSTGERKTNNGRPIR
jgi:putative ABC transport system permease protein